MKSLITFLAIALSTVGYSQSLKADIQRLNSVYGGDSFTAHYLYQFSINGTAKTNESVKIQRQGQMYYAKTNKVTQVGDAKKTLTIYTDDKLMVVSNPNRKEQNPYEVDLDALMDLIDSSTLIQDSAHRRTYRMYYKETHEFDELLLVFNPKTSQIEYIELIERQGKDVATLKISFVSFSKRVNKLLFDGSEFAEITEKGVTTKSKYKNFKVIDNRVNLKR